MRRSTRGVREAWVWTTWVVLLCSLTWRRLDAASIEGQVTLPKARSVVVMNQRYEMVVKGGVIAPNPPLAIVYLEGNFPLAEGTRTERMVQTNFTFVPGLLPVRVGSRVEFPNLDTGYHNIFSYSPAKRFDLGRYRSEERPIPSQVFDRAGLVTLRCDIHEHMRAAILVLETPHYVMTDFEGRFRMTNLPTGGYKLKAWVSSKTTFEVPVDLATNQTLRVNLP